MGVKKTKVMVEEQFYWSGMGRDIKLHCKSCPFFLQFNTKKTRKEPLDPLPAGSSSSK